MKVTNKPALLPSTWSYGSVVVGVIMLAIYATLIVVQKDHSFLEALPWAMLMAIAAGAAFVGGRMGNGRAARNMMVAAALLFALLGAASIFTIGVGFLVAAGLATVARTRLSRQ
jgi:hypothetical protein